MNATEYTGLSIIGALLLFGIGLSWMNRIRKKKQIKKLLREFDDFIIQNSLTIDNRQRLNKNIIGIDRLNYAVVFSNNSTKKIQLILLKELAECRMVKERNKPGGHIQRIFLRCHLKKKESPEIILPFYDEMNDGLFMMLPLSKKAAFWAKRINILREAAKLKHQKLLSV